MAFGAPLCEIYQVFCFVDAFHLTINPAKTERFFQSVIGGQSFMAASTSK